ncbi:fluoride efflux transporter FluC [Psychromicrobium xiongbiense]|uniref:fluoride efflux transporter FluC n=1 Tax=Psychromicrobium xiongbiense TaxID=3051184 RepID=UPI002554730F|nr:CrcB family protein [Psychromicrobium sp. YIM S02556]
MTALLIGCAGMLGGLLRFAVDALFARGGRFAPGRPSHWPLATLVVNAIGSFIIGAAAGLTASAHLSEQAHTVLATGFAGGLTTFSSFAVATVSLWRQGHRWRAAISVAANLALGLALAWWGFSLTHH